MASPLLTLTAFAALLLALGWGAAATLRGRQSAAQASVLRAQLRERDAALERSEARRAAAEAECRAVDERYQHALRGSQDGLWEWSPASGRVQMSPRWTGMLGFGPDELRAEHAAWIARVHPDDRGAFEATLARHLDGSDARFEHEMRLLHKDGSVRHVLSRGVAVRDESGAPVRLLGLDTDITRLKRVQGVLDAVADGTTGAHGERFFAAMAQHFARALDVDCAFIAECIDEPATRVRTLAYWSVDQGLRENFEFALAGTPCDDVIKAAQTCFHPDGLAEKYPREAGWEGYIGMPIVSSDGRVLGHLAMRHRKPLGDGVLIDRVYRIFLARASAELERMQALARLALMGGAPAVV